MNVIQIIVVICAHEGPEHIWASHLSIFFGLSIAILAFLHFYLTIIFNLSIAIWALFAIGAFKSKHIFITWAFNLSKFCHVSIFIWAFLTILAFLPVIAISFWNFYHLKHKNRSSILNWAVNSTIRLSRISIPALNSGGL